MKPARVSVVIVSYNAKEFLHLCLTSLFNCKGIESTEVIVVDNASIDGSADEVRSKFPQVILVSNEVNLGFTRACNMGASLANGEHLIFLNPDTLVPSHTLEEVVAALSNDDATGGVGVELYDGAGRYLKESGRRIPTPVNAMIKLIGLTSVLGKIFSSLAYYAHRDETAPAILPGAFLAIRKARFVELNGFDERFFMYGEDIDLSFRMIRKGWINRKLTGVDVLHFKGESTDKAIPDYAEHFYGAFEKYSVKHKLVSPRFGLALMRWILYLIKLRYRIRRTFRSSLRGITHVLVFLVSFYATHKLWAMGYFSDYDYFPEPGLFKGITVYAACMLFAFYFQGIYLKGASSRYQYQLALIGGGVLCLITYAVFPVNLRFSRMSLVLGIAVIWMLFYLWHKLRGRRHTSLWRRARTTLISDSTMNPVTDIELLTGYGIDRVESYKESGHDHFKPLPDVLLIDVSAQKINALIDLVKQYGKKCRIILIAPDRSFCLSSQEASVRGTVHRELNRYNIARPLARHQKGIYDRLFSLGLIIFMPYALLRSLSFRFLTNWWGVMRGDFTLVSYMPQKPDGALPTMPQGFISPSNYSDGQRSEPADVARLYAINYSVLIDLYSCMGNFGTLINNLTWTSPSNR